MRDVDCGDVAHGAMDVSAVVHRGTLSVDASIPRHWWRRRHVAYSRFTGEVSGTHWVPLAYTPSNDYAGDDALFVTASDRGNTGRGGAQQTSLEVPLFVDASCDAPVIKPIQKVVMRRGRRRVHRF